MHLMNNLSSYCGLIDSKIRASDKDLPVTIAQMLFTYYELFCFLNQQIWSKYIKLSPKIQILIITNFDHKIPGILRLLLNTQKLSCYKDWWAIGGQQSRPQRRQFKLRSLKRLLLNNLEQFIQTVKGQNIFWDRIHTLFSLAPQI